MKRIFLLNIILAAFATGALTACSDDETSVIVQESDLAGVHQSDATYNSLTFAWSKVDGVNQYGYTLCDADGAVVADGVTQYTTVTFTDLHTDTPYSFELRVYKAFGEASYRTTIAACTLPIRQLDTPQPMATQVGNKVHLTWEAVAGAYAYQYTYTIDENVISAVTNDNGCYITGLAPGTHQVTVEALSDYGGYTDSKTATLTVQRSRAEVATVNGNYTCGLMRRNNTWPCTMHIFDDATYVIDAFYQGEGYNLDFYVDTDPDTGESFIGLYSFASFPACEYYVVDTGRASVPQIEAIPGLVNGVYGSSFTIDATSGTMTMNTRYDETTGVDKFVWAQ